MTSSSRVISVLLLPTIVGLSVLYIFLLTKTFRTHHSVAGTSQTVEMSVTISVCGDGVIMGGEQCEGEDLGGATCRDVGYAQGDLSCDDSCQFIVSNCTHPLPIPSTKPSGPPAASPSGPPAASPSIPPLPSTANSAASDHRPTSPASNAQNEEHDSIFNELLTPSEILKKVTPIFVLHPSPDQSDSTQSASATQFTYSSANSLPPVLLPQFKNFDTDGDNQIDVNKVEEAVELWTSEWSLHENIPRLELSLITQGRINKQELLCDLNYNNVCNVVDFSILLSMVQPPSLNEE